MGITVSIFTDIISFVVAGSDDRYRFRQFDCNDAICKCTGRISDTDSPWASIRFVTDKTDVASNIQESCFHAFFHHFRSRIFSCISLGNTTDIQRCSFFCNVDCRLFFIDDNVFPATFFMGCLQFVHRRNRSIFSVCIQFNAFCTVVMPYFQQGSLSDIEFFLRKIIEHLCTFQHIDDQWINLNRSSTCIVVDGFQVVDSFVVVIDIKQLIAVGQSLDRVFVSCFCISL